MASGQKKAVSLTEKTVRCNKPDKLAKRTVGFSGLLNKANNCWFNATLQALGHTTFGEWLTGKAVLVSRVCWTS